MGSPVCADGTYGACLDLQKASGPFRVGNGTRDKVSCIPFLKFIQYKAIWTSEKTLIKTLERCSLNIQELQGEVLAIVLQV